LAALQLTYAYYFGILYFGSASDVIEFTLFEALISHFW